MILFQMLFDILITFREIIGDTLVRAGRHPLIVSGALMKMFNCRYAASINDCNMGAFEGFHINC